MTLLGSLGRIYTLDTLDSRLTISSKTPPRKPEATIAEAKLPAKEALQNGKPGQLSGVRPSKWNTMEFYFYYFCFLAIPFFMVKSVYDVSKGTVYFHHAMSLC